MTPEQREALAAEYVLGTLDAAGAKRVELAAAEHPALAEEIEDWEAALAPLLLLAPPEAPPPELWERIERAIAPRKVVRKGWSLGGFWQGWSIGATAVAGALAAVLLVRAPAPVAPERLVTVLLTQREQPAWVVEADGGGIRLAAVNRQAVAADQRVQQLWALAPGATAPVSLGLIPREAGQVVVGAGAIRPEPGMLIEITLEPPGGSPTGRPTGPVQFIGRLSRAVGT